MLDFLSDILVKLSLRGTLYFRTSFTEPWGVRVPAYRNVARFHLVDRGEAMIQVADHEPPVLLSQGDLVIIPHGAEHVLSCRFTGPDTALPLEDVLTQSGYNGEGALVFGGKKNDRDTQLICGHFEISDGARHLLFEQLPSLIHLQGYGKESGPWLEATLKVISEETGDRKPGGDLIALKMSEVIFAQAIRAFIEQRAESESGLCGFGDPFIAKALTAFHRDPAAQWTVAALAREAGLSRTGLADRFTAKMGVTPMNYVTSWRMQIARQALAEEGLSVVDAAERVGYASESAFTRAFRSEVGTTPAAFRKAHRSDDT